MLKFIGNNCRWIVGGFTLTYFSSFGQTNFISASIAEWQSAFGLSHGEIGRFYPSVTVPVIAIFLLRLFGQGMMTHIALTSTGRWFVVERDRAILPPIAAAGLHAA